MIFYRISVILAYVPYLAESGAPCYAIYALSPKVWRNDPGKNVQAQSPK